MVLPSISPLSDTSALGARSIDVPPPLKFKPLKGLITEVKIGAEIAFAHINTNMSFARIAGLKYERGFLEYLRKKWSPVTIHPHIHFRDDGAYRTAIPDGIAFTPNGVVVFEVKSQHMPEAWWQLEKLYMPIISAAFPDTEVRGIEVVKIYDPQIKWPGQYVLYNDLDDAIMGSSHLGVLKWRKQT